VEAWQRRAEWPLTFTAVLFLAAYATPILRPQLPENWRAACRAVVILTWALFAADYMVRLLLATHRWRYFWRHLLDLAIVVLPVLRPLRLLRLVMLLRVLNRRAAQSLRGRIAVYVASATGLLIGCASLAVLDAERGHASATIRNFPDALWWSVSTITTVGYGDRFPVTSEGRLIAVGLMLGGIALLGVVTASIASWFLDRVKETEEQAQAATQADLLSLRDEVQQLRKLLEASLSEPHLDRT
jgi:voltage-gated potassium channel